MALFEGRMGQKNNNVAVKIERELIRGTRASDRFLDFALNHLLTFSRHNGWHGMDPRNRSRRAARRNPVPGDQAGAGVGRAEARPGFAGSAGGRTSTPAPIRRKTAFSACVPRRTAPGGSIESSIAKSASLKDDLAFLTERGDRLADRLDGLVRRRPGR